AHERARERGAPPRLCGRASRGTKGAGRGGIASRGAGGASGPSSEPALGRTAATRGNRARHRESTEAARRGRAHGQSRFEDERRDHGALPGARARGADYRPRHARARHRGVRLARAGRARWAHSDGPAAGAPDRRSERGRFAGGGVVSIFVTIRIALLALMRNKMRSFLTVLGVIIGVGAVIAMVAIGEGAKARVEETFNAMGSNLLIIMPGSTTAGGVRGGWGSMPTLTWDDLRAIRTEVPSVRYASPQLRSTVQLVSEDANWSTSLYGVSPEYFDLRNWPVEVGARFEQPEIDAGA